MRVSSTGGQSTGVFLNEAAADRAIRARQKAAEVETMLASDDHCVLPAPSASSLDPREALYAREGIKRGDARRISAPNFRRMAFVLGDKVMLRSRDLDRTAPCVEADLTVSCISGDGETITCVATEPIPGLACLYSVRQEANQGPEGTYLKRSHFYYELPARKLVRVPESPFEPPAQDDPPSAGALLPLSSWQ